MKRPLAAATRPSGVSAGGPASRRGSSRLLTALAASALLVLGCEDDSPPEGADLRLADLRIPSATSLAQGTTVTMSVVVSSHGTETVTEDFEVSLAFYSDADHSQPHAWPERVWQVTEDLASGEWRRFDHAITISESDPTGMVRCVAAVRITDLIDYNNVVVRSCQVTGGGAPPPVEPDKPDLRILSVSAPAAVERGSEFSVSVDVRNDGGAAAAGPFSVDVSAYSDQAHESALWTPQAAERTEDLPAGEEATFEVAFTVRPDDDLTPVYLVASVDPQDQVLESNEGNNEAEAETEVVLPPDPDVKVAGISAPVQIPHETTAAVRVTIANSGGGTALAPFHVTLNVYDSEDLSTAIRPEASWEVTVNLTPGGQLSHDFPFTPTEADGVGFVYFQATADAGDVVVEVTEQNNQATAKSQIVLAPKPDLVAAVESCSDTFDTSDPAARIDVTYRITNSGSAAALGSLVMAELREQGGAVVESFGPFAVPSLDPGGSHTATESLDPASPLAPDVYYDLFVVADGSSVVDEEDESNNDDFHTVLVY
jgi:hypothetical protein